MGQQRWAAGQAGRCWEVKLQEQSNCSLMAITHEKWTLGEAIAPSCSAADDRKRHKDDPWKSLNV
eukprot:11113302-Karenia_brevis.AAC.1